MKKSTIPELIAEPRTDLPGGWKVWCPFCKVWHAHGTGPLPYHRLAHCSTSAKSPFTETGYILRARKKSEK